MCEREEGGGTMTRATVAVAVLAVSAALTSLACGGGKKRHVTKEELQTVSDYVDRSMRAAGVTADERKKYVVSQLGAPHRTEGEMQYWYTTVLDCYYLQVGEDGWASWGVGATSDCKKWSVPK
jgi:hypothetical protein